MSGDSSLHFQAAESVNEKGVKIRLLEANPERLPRAESLVPKCLGVLKTNADRWNSRERRKRENEADKKDHDREHRKKKKRKNNRREGERQTPTSPKAESGRQSASLESRVSERERLKSLKRERH